MWFPNENTVPTDTLQTPKRFELKCTRAGYKKRFMNEALAQR